MSSNGHNAKKPKLASHTSGTDHGQIPALLSGAEGTEPVKHHVSFAQHQHEQQVALTDQPLQEAPLQHLKSDAQQHQQKAGSRRH